MGTQVAAANGWRRLQGVFHGGVGVGVVDGQVGLHLVRTLSELNIDLADSDSPSTYNMSTDWVPGARSLAHVILSNENRKKTQVRKPRPKEVGDLLRFPWFRLPAQTPSAIPQLVTFAGWQTQLLATQLALDKLCREQAAG